MSANLKPYGVRYCHETRTSIIFDSCFRPIAKFPGKWPRVKHGTPCGIDEPRCYSGDRTFFYRSDDAPRCDPAVRRRLRDLSSAFPVLAAELSRRISQAAEAAKPVDLITKTFG